jgi:hypothetical protein
MDYSEPSAVIVPIAVIAIEDVRCLFEKGFVLLILQGSIYA